MNEFIKWLCDFMWGAEGQAIGWLLLVVLIPTAIWLEFFEEKWRA